MKLLLVEDLIKKLEKADPKLVIAFMDDCAEESTPLAITHDYDQDEPGKFILTWHPDYTR